MRKGLSGLVADFSGEMLSKLHAKQREGWVGWNDDGWISDADLEEDLMKHIARARLDPDQWIDVANYCAFLWRRDARREKKSA